MNREGHVIYINGTVKEGDENSWNAEHVDLMNEYCEDYDLDWEDLKKLPIVYGNLVEDDTVVLYAAENCEISSILDLMKTIYTKVYTIDENNRAVLAKKMFSEPAQLYTRGKSIEELEQMVEDEKNGLTDLQRKIMEQPGYEKFFRTESQWRLEYLTDKTYD